MKFITKLQRLNACSDAIKWAEQYKTFQEAWDKCERADWMLWIAGKLADKNGNRKEVVLCACKCTRTALKYLPKNEKRPLKCIQTVEKWAKGKATIEEVREARAATAYAAAAYAADDAAYAAADAAAYAADAAYAATAYAAADAAAYAAADAAAYAADDAAYAAARIKSLKSLANIVRKSLKCPAL